MQTAHTQGLQEGMETTVLEDAWWPLFTDLIFIFNIFFIDFFYLWRKYTVGGSM